MALDGISDSYATLFASMRARGGNSHPANGAGFAEFVPDEVSRAARAAATALQSSTVSRILQVGIQRYIEEQIEVEQVMRILYVVGSEADPDVREEIDKIAQDLKQDPPLNGADALERIGKRIDDIPDDALRLRMKKVLARIEWLMNQPDDEIAKLEAAAKERAGAIEKS